MTEFLIYFFPLEVFDRVKAKNFIGIAGIQGDTAQKRIVADRSASGWQERVLDLVPEELNKKNKRFQVATSPDVGSPLHPATSPCLIRGFSA